MKSYVHKWSFHEEVFLKRAAQTPRLGLQSENINKIPVNIPEIRQVSNIRSN